MHKVLVYAITGLFLAWITILPMRAHAYPPHTPHWTLVEKKFLASSSRQWLYPDEYYPIIEVRNSYELGKLTALRFIEWVQKHPTGVVALTSGTTPEFFVKFLDFYKNNWRMPEVQEELHSMGIKGKKFPDTTRLKLVQIEEIYPLSEKHYKKISNYVERHYAKILGVKKENLLLMELTKKGIIAEKGMNVVFMNGKVDLSILNRKPTSQLEGWQQQALKDLRAYCNEYEAKIRAWGGIDFFIGGVSYGGHLAFDEPGGRADSKTHFVELDYSTAASTAKDMGGIDFARGKVAVTIGLGTITIKPKAVMIIIAAGEVKAPVIRDAVENKANIKYPASMLQNYPNSRMYLTDGAAKLLDNRRTEDVKFNSKHGWIQKHVEEVVIEVSLAENKPILSLSMADMKRHARGRLLLENPPKPLATMLVDTHNSIVKKIDSGLKISSIKANKIMHTAPHHDDILLSYYQTFDNFTHKFKNHIVYFTSGFNSVTDSYVLSAINRASDWWLQKEQDLIFKRPYDKIMSKFREHYVKQDVEQMNMLDTAIAMRNLVAVYDLKNMDELKQTIRWLKDGYFPSKQPGDLDVAEIKALKGMMRESEAERLWSLKNMPLSNITHLRSRFYSGREFMKTPRYDDDVAPFISLFKKIRPDIITVDDEPQSAPVITQYRVLQIIAQGLRDKNTQVSEDIQVWGYRNIWFKYDVHEANIFVPVSEQALSAQKRAFESCFNTQKMTSFPSPFYEGDFASLSNMVQREQFANLKTLLGAEYFEKNSMSELKNAAGFVFINQMSLNEFFRKAEDLQAAIDLEEAYIASKK